MPQRKQTQSWLKSDRLKNQIAQALPTHLTPDRFMRIIFTSMQKTPKLMNCTQESLFSALIDCSQLGIEPDGRRAHLIPYGNQCQLIIDYKGLVELVMRSGEVSKVHADTVCDNDDFEFNMGTITKHHINFRKPRGKAYAVYAVATLKDGNEVSEVMTVEDVEKIRAKSKSSSSSPWRDHWGEMAKKTVFRRLSKWLPLSPELKEKITKDDNQFDLDKNQEVRSPEQQGMADSIMDAMNASEDQSQQEKNDKAGQEYEDAEIIEEEENEPEEEEKSEPKQKPEPKQKKKEEETEKTISRREQTEILDYAKYLDKKDQTALAKEISKADLTVDQAQEWKAKIKKAKDQADSASKKK